ncbi:outer membrane protein with beta-barrel domain [Flavobacterium sp. 1]|uniref:outer membrane beta-barrel protein n=1 Tax=Flavobacterium sp. 1 TaxID=2035200 RepID=UPI000CB12EA2|nr:outer membrane beta-barrel protein [Flavobacterium sp. 1]PJJ06921.1 outer membrane protein with beta-barrel domain [Flavobacterium sp. 1]
MKKILLLLVTVFAINFVDAQETVMPKATFSKGNMWIEGGISLTTGDSSDDYFAMTPKVGFFLDEKWAIGADINYASVSYLPNSNNLDKSDSFGIGGFARYYFLNLGNFKAYGEAGLGYNHSELNYLNGSSNVNNGIKANIDLGINYFFTPKWAATFTLAEVLSYNNTSPENGDNTSDLVININLFNNIFAQPKFGLLYKW